jgi:hypothetical protein
VGRLGRVAEREERWGRGRWRSSLTLKQAKKQPMPLETEISTNRTTDLHTSCMSRFSNELIMDLLGFSQALCLSFSATIISFFFFFFFFYFFFGSK